MMKCGHLGLYALTVVAIFAPTLCAADKSPTGNSADALAMARRIDEFLAVRWTKDQVQPAPIAEDAEFLRRIYLDMAGRVPSIVEAKNFFDDKSPEKRARLIEQLVGSSAYVNHFTNYWRSLLMADLNANFDAINLTPEFESWLRKQVSGNVAYNKMVREIVTVAFETGRTAAMPVENPTENPTPRAFFLAKDVKPENLAASTARLFLGIRLECAQCHHHPFAHWKREQFWGYAAFFAGLQRQKQQDAEGAGPIREVFDRRELGIPGSTQIVSAAFLDGREPRWRYKVGSRVTLADWMTSPANPYFARAAVNRMWGNLFGVGIVDPIDDLEGQNQPSHPELLNELAQQFAAHQFDWKYLIRSIALSQAYQRSSITTHESQNEPQRFARMAIKGLTGEQVFDSIIQATGYVDPTPPSRRSDVVPAMNALRGEFMARFANNQEKKTDSQTSILQALALMNGRFIADVATVKGKGTLATVANDVSLTNPQRLETLFVAVLSRRPTSDESARLLKYVDSGGVERDSKQALADVFWALLNSGEFILNH